MIPESRGSKAGSRLPCHNPLSPLERSFNLTNAARFDTSTVTMYQDRPGFGRYNSTLATCDGRAGRQKDLALANRLS